MRVWSFTAFALLLAAGCAHREDGHPYVASLELKGVRNVSRHRLEKGLASKPAPKWMVGPQHDFDELELQRDRVRVQRFYETQGYFAAKVVEAEGKQREGSRAVDVKIAVEEGPPTLIGDVAVFGVDGLDEKTRKKIQQHQLGLRRGQVFHHEDYLEFKAKLVRELQKRGFRDAQVDGAVNVVPESNLANIVLTFHPKGFETPPASQAEAEVTK